MSKTPNLKRQAIMQRTRARRQLLQALYQWQLSNDEAADVYHNRIIDLRQGDIDQHYFDNAYHSITAAPETLEAQYSALMTRKPTSLDPVERAVLWIGAYELNHRPDIHPTVVINEAVELAKQFGGEDGYKFVNGILDKLAKALPQQANKI